jgi:hypothetical protein
MNFCSASRFLDTVSTLGNADELIEMLMSVAKRADELARSRSLRSPQIDRETWLLAEAQVLSFGFAKR